MTCSGYMSPEYAMEGIFSEKSDVFSFGVMVLEILSGKRSRTVSPSEPCKNLLQHVRDEPLQFITTHESRVTSDIKQFAGMEAMEGRQMLEAG